MSTVLEENSDVDIDLYFDDIEYLPLIYNSDFIDHKKSYKNIMTRSNFLNKLL